MDHESNIRTLRPLPPPSALACAMCSSRVDVVLCSFAFERIHRRVPLCREHRQPLLEIDHFTRPDAAVAEDLPAAWAPSPWIPPAQRRLPRRRPLRESARAAPGGTVLLLPVR